MKCGNQRSEEVEMLFVLTQVTFHTLFKKAFSNFTLLILNHKKCTVFQWTCMYLTTTTRLAIILMLQIRGKHEKLGYIFF